MRVVVFLLAASWVAVGMFAALGAQKFRNTKAVRPVFGVISASIAMGFYEMTNKETLGSSPVFAPARGARVFIRGGGRDSNKAAVVVKTSDGRVFMLPVYEYNGKLDEKSLHEITWAKDPVTGGPKARV